MKNNNIDNQSRTAKSIKNSTVALIMYTLNLVLQFYSRKIFLDYLGTEILGLNTTATNILQFLNLAELGISSAVAFSLYKPLSEGDIDSVNEIVSLQGHIYRRIALMIISASVIVMCFFPWIFAKIELPLWYAYVSFGVLLLSSLLGYFFNFRQVVLSASQQEYKIVYSFKSINLIKVLAQMIAVYYFENGFVWWASIEAVFSIIGAYFLHRTTMKTFPYLKNTTTPLNVLRKKYHIIEVKVKQLFFHKASGFALNQISPLIIYAYGTLTEVTYYQNYMLIYLGFISLMAALFNGINASIGNVSVTDSKKLILVFRELFSVRFFLSLVISFLFYHLTPQFISLWIGPEYLLDNSTLLIISILLFIALSRQTVENYLYALGQFQDVAAPIIEMSLNVGLSIWLGYLYGINGILIGVGISLVIIVLLWKPYFLFKIGLKTKYNIYAILFIKHCAIGFLAIILVNNLISHIHFSNNTWSTFIVYSILLTTIFSIVLALGMIICRCEIRMFFKRIINYLKA